MRAWNLIVMAILLMLTATGCGALKIGRKKKAADKAPPPSGAMTLIGTVEMVNPEQKYVLIRCEVLPSLAAGTELIALDASGAQSRLALTPERKGLYLTADVKNGSPNVSNVVVLRKGAAPDGTPATPVAPPAPPAAPAAPPPSVAVPPVPMTTPFPQPPLPSPTVPLEPPLPTQTKRAPPP